MEIISILQQLSAPLTTIPGVEPVTSLALIGLATSFLVAFLSNQFLGGETKIRNIFTPSGIVLLASFIAVDYWKFKGYEANTYIGSILLSNADLVAFFLGLLILGSFLDWDFPDKWETFKNVLSGWFN
jgi:hypothetical protein